jgi:hypothetical protein
MWEEIEKDMIYTAGHTNATRRKKWSIVELEMNVIGERKELEQSRIRGKGRRKQR